MNINSLLGPFSIIYIQFHCRVTFLLSLSLKLKDSFGTELSLWESFIGRFKEISILLTHELKINARKNLELGLGSIMQH